MHLTKPTRPFLAATMSALARARARLAAFEDRRNERQILRCRCAIHDRPFEAVFIRKQGAARFVLETTRDTAGGNTGASGPSAITTSFELARFDLNALSCPYCNAGNFIVCGRCGAYVCDGRSGQQRGGFYFRCARSCGNEGTTGILRTIKMRKPVPRLQVGQNEPLPRLPQPKAERMLE